MSGLTVWDGHCHLASSDTIPAAFMRDIVRSVARRLEAEGMAYQEERLFEAFAAQNQDHLGDQLVQEMDACGIERTVLLAPDFSMCMETPLSLAEMAERHHAVRLRHPGRFWVFMGVDPRRGADGVDDLEDMVRRYAFEGIKLYPPCGYSPSDKRLYPYYEVCRDLKLIVFLHTGPTIASLDHTFSHPMEVEAAVRAFPEVPFILGHGGIVHVEAASRLAAQLQNVYLDVGGFAGSPLRGGWQAHLGRLFSMGLNHRIIFGTDWPLNRMSGGLRRVMAELQHAESVRRLSDEDRRLVFAGNLASIISAVEVEKPGQPLRA